MGKKSAKLQKRTHSFSNTSFLFGSASIMKSTFKVHGQSSYRRLFLREVPIRCFLQYRETPKQTLSKEREQTQAPNLNTDKTKKGKVLSQVFVHERGKSRQRDYRFGFENCTSKLQLVVPLIEYPHA